MLVLSRHKDEKIVMKGTGKLEGVEIKLMIVDIRGGVKVRVGIDAPEELIVHRAEIWELIELQQEAEELAKREQAASE